jgi:hypothetical protein
VAANHETGEFESPHLHTSTASGTAGRLPFVAAMVSALWTAVTAAVLDRYSPTEIDDAEAVGIERQHLGRAPR